MTAVPALSEDFKTAALAERARLQTEREAAEAVVATLRMELRGAEEKAEAVTRKVREIDELLGLAPQLSLEGVEGELRGARLREVALYVLQHEIGEEPVHYRRWYELVTVRYRVAGKDPLATFLAAISRISAIEKVGRRSGLYQLRAA